MIRPTVEARRCLVETTTGMARQYRSWLLPAETGVPASRIRDPEWMREQLRSRGLIWNTDDARVLATLWWYSASARMIAPAIASLVVSGRPLSPRLDDLLLHSRPDSRLSGVTSTALLPLPSSAEATANVESPALSALGTALGELFAETIPAVAAAGAMRERPLWALATDAIAGRLLWAGEASATVERAISLAEPLVANVATTMPRPRYTRTHPGDQVTTKRVSCCLLYRVPGQHKCGGCPGKPRHARR